MSFGWGEWIPPLDGGSVALRRSRRQRRRGDRVTELLSLLVEQGPVRLEEAGDVADLLPALLAQGAVVLEGGMLDARHVTVHTDYELHPQFFVSPEAL